MQYNLTHSERAYLKSLDLLALSSRINIITTVVVSLIGLIGNAISIYVFAQKRFRRNSSHVYLLCLAVCDSLFIIVHLLEDTLKAYKDIFIEYQNKFINQFIITDHNEITCRFINYLRLLIRNFTF